MWNDFSDYELAEIAAQYGFQDELDFGSDLQLTNRNKIEDLLTAYEFDNAFAELDKNPELV